MTNCRLIHPIATAMLPQLSRHSWLALVAAGLLTGFALVLIPLIVRKREQRAQDGLAGTAFIARDGRQPFTLSTWALVALGLAILVWIALAVAAPLGDWLTQGGQPMLLLEGISLWPTIFLRMATLLLCIWLLLYSLDQLDANMRSRASSSGLSIFLACSVRRMWLFLASESGMDVVMRSQSSSGGPSLYNAYGSCALGSTLTIMEFDLRPVPGTWEVIAFRPRIIGSSKICDYGPTTLLTT